MATARKWRSGYQARWYRPDGTQATRSGFKSRKAALEFGSLMEADKLRGTYNDPSLAKVIFSDWATHWLTTKLRLKPTTLSGYESVLRTHILPEFGGIQIGKIDPILVQDWVAALERTGLSSAMMRQAYQCFSAIMKAAVESGYLGRSPCVGVRIPRIPVREKLFLDEWQVSKLAEAIRDPYQVLIYVLAYGGLRWGEAVALQRKNCDLVRSRLLVNESVSEISGTLHRGPTKTYEKRQVVLPTFVREILEQYLETNVARGPDALLFTAPEGGPLRYSNFRKRSWNPAVKKTVELPANLTPHHLRHTCASLLIKTGAHPKAVQGHLGHSTITVTMDVYGHLYPDEMDALAERLDLAHRQAMTGPAKVRRLSK